MSRLKPFYEVRPEKLFAGEICEYPYSMHMHAAVEIVHLRRGSLTMTVNTRAYTMSPGDTMVIFPSMPHSYDSMSPDMDGLCVIFTPNQISEFTNVFLTMRPVSTYLPAVKLTSGIKEAVDMLILRSREKDSPFISCYLHVLLTHLMMVMDLIPLEKYTDSSLLQKVIEYISAHFDSNITLDSIATDLYVSRSHLSHIFSEQLNINFRKYVNILRADKACTLLRSTGASVTEIAYACGYNNQRTFHRTFIETTGVTPVEYRNSSK